MEKPEVAAAIGNLREAILGCSPTDCQRNILKSIPHQRVVPKFPAYLAAYLR